MGLIKNRNIFHDEDFYFMSEVEFPLEAFYAYIDSTEEIINGIKAKIAQNKNFLENADPQEINAQFDHIGHEITILLPELHFHALYISLYSLFERKLLRLCTITEKNRVVKINDLRGEGIFKYKLYLEKVGELDLTFLNPLWEKLIKYNKLRNHIVHKSNYSIELTESNKHLIETLKSIPNITIHEQNNFIDFEIKKELILDLINLSYNYLKSLYYEN